MEINIGDKIGDLTFLGDVGYIERWGKKFLYGFFECRKGKKISLIKRRVLRGYNKYCSDKNCKCKAEDYANRKYIHVKEEKLLCTVCKKYKEESEFDKSKNCDHRKGRDKRCKKCKILERKRLSLNINTDLPEDERLVKMLKNRYLGMRGRADRQGINLEIGEGDLKDLWDNQCGICALSNIPMTFTTGSGRTPTNISVDKINPNLGYIKGNVQLVCSAVNQMKSDLTEEEFNMFIKAIYDTYKNKKI